MEKEKIINAWVICAGWKAGKYISKSMDWTDDPKEVMLFDTASAASQYIKDNRLDPVICNPIACSTFEKINGLKSISRVTISVDREILMPFPSYFGAFGGLYYKVKWPRSNDMIQIPFTDEQIKKGYPACYSIEENESLSRIISISSPITEEEYEDAKKKVLEYLNK